MKKIIKHFKRKCLHDVSLYVQLCELNSIIGIELITMGKPKPTFNNTLALLRLSFGKEVHTPLLVMLPRLQYFWNGSIEFAFGGYSSFFEYPLWWLTAL